MSKTILSEYLDCGLFNIGDDDSRLQVFQQAANDLAAEFLKTPAFVISAVLVAVDPAVTETDPMLDKIEAAIKAHWNTFTNKYQERPLGLLRPVLLDALRQAAEKNDAIASAIWLTGLNLTCRIDLASERSILDSFLKSLGEVNEQQASGAWKLAAKVSFKPPTFELKVSKPAVPKMDANSLETELAASVGPQHRDGRALVNQNPQWSNNSANWSYHFAPRAAIGIAKEVDKAIAPLLKTTVPDDLQSATNSFARELANSVAKWVNLVAVPSSRQIGLLCWKAALYSPSLNCSYRDLSPSEVVISMAHDLYQLTSAPSPLSVEYFLRETVRLALPDNPELSIHDLMQPAKGDRFSSLIKATVPPAKPQRVSLQTALSYARQLILTENDLEAWLGVKGSLRVRADSLAIWLFRDTQAMALMEKSSGK